MDTNMLYAQILVFIYFSLTLLTTKFLCTRFRITPLAAFKTRYDLKVTMLAVSLLIIVLLMIIARSVWPSDIWNIVWLFVFIFWILPWLFAIIHGDFKIIGITRQNILTSLLMGITGFIILIAIFLIFIPFFPQLPEYLRAPWKSEIDITGLIILLANLLFSPSLTEEIPYRGFLLGRLQACSSAARANLLQASLFALLHITNIIFYGDWLNPINAFLGGIVYGYLYQKTGNIAGSYVLHWLTISFAHILAFEIV